jgi:hypothetical protein
MPCQVDIGYTTHLDIVQHQVVSEMNDTAPLFKICTAQIGERFINPDTQLRPTPSIRECDQHAARDGIL